MFSKCKVVSVIKSSYTKNYTDLRRQKRSEIRVREIGYGTLSSH